MQIEDTAFPEVKILTPRRFGDQRGWFAETWSRRHFAEVGIIVDFVQDNVSYTANKGVIRGLHYQAVPCAQAKLVQVLRGRVLDVAVDIRKASPTFGRYVAVELDAASGRMLYVPCGFAHGFCTLEEDVLFTYKVSDYYSPANDRAILWSDPDIGISWPVDTVDVIVSAKDGAAPRLRDATDLF